MAKYFSISNYGKGSVKFSIDKLKKINSHFTQNLPYEKALKYIPQDIAEENKQEFWNIVKDNIENVNELSFWQNILFNSEMKYEIKNKELAKALLENLPADLNEESFKETVAKIKEQTNLKGKELFIGIRQALTSLEHGPELSKVVNLMSLESIKNRLKINS